MGIIQKQAIKGTFYSYLGVAVGFVTTGLLYPHILTTDEIGLLNLLVAFSTLLAQFASLGFNSVINRLFPFFRDSEKGHKGFLTIAIITSLVGFGLVSAIFKIFKPIIIENNIEDSSLFVDYINLIFPLFFFTLFFNLLDSYNKALYDAVLGTFLKEFIQRILILLILLLYFVKIINLALFIYGYVFALTSPAIIISLVLIFRREFKFLLPLKEVYTKSVVRNMLILSLFGIISGFGTIAVFQIDKLLINKFLGLSDTGIYSINYFFATLVIIPSRPLIKISTTIIADSWKNNDNENIQLVYKKSVINQGIIGLIIFSGIWINIHNIYQILPAEYASGKWVILFIGLANLVGMISGVSGTIITTSHKFKAHTYFILIYILLIVLLNFILTPELGITGAALSFFISTLLFNIIRFLFILIKFRMNPYNLKIGLFLLFSVPIIFIVRLVPALSNFYIDILIRSSLFLILIVSVIYYMKISSDINNIINQIIHFIKHPKKSN